MRLRGTLDLTAVSILPTSFAALTGHSQAIATLRCSFPEADIGNGAQHFGGADDCIADLDETALAVLALVAGVVHRF